MFDPQFSLVDMLHCFAFTLLLGMLVAAWGEDIPKWLKKS